MRPLLGARWVPGLCPNTPLAICPFSPHPVKSGFWMPSSFFAFSLLSNCSVFLFSSNHGACRFGRPNQRRLVLWGQPHSDHLPSIQLKSAAFFFFISILLLNNSLKLNGLLARMTQHQGSLYKPTTLPSYFQHRMANDFLCFRQAGKHHHCRGVRAIYRWQISSPPTAANEVQFS